MNWKIHIPKSVTKRIKIFPLNDHKRIITILHEFEIDPWQGDIAKIKGEANLWRRRIGSYRIFYSPDVKLKIVQIKEIERRTSTTY